MPPYLWAASTESTELLRQGNHLYYMQGDSEGSYSYYQRAAEQGNPLAKAQIAKMLYLGAGVSTNKPQAEKIFAQVLPEFESTANSGDDFA